MSAYIGGFQIAMDDALLVRHFQGMGDLVGNRERLGERDRPTRDPPREILSLDELHDDGVDTLGVFQSVNDRDVRMFNEARTFASRWNLTSRSASAANVSAGS